MEYCSIEDAYGPPNQEARKQERKKAKRCKGPPLTFLSSELEAAAADPDRPAAVKKPVPPALGRNPETGLQEHTPVDADVGTYEPFRDSSNAVPTQAYFGQDSQADFSNVIGNANEYKLGPEFMDAFREVGTLNGAGATATLPTPSVRDIWKPLTPGGVSSRSSFFERLPPPGGEYYQPPAAVSSSAMKDVHAKLDKIFSRLDTIDQTKSGNDGSAQTEVLLFIMSGIFVLFLTDLAVRKGGNGRYY
jgi:hypothetical protein